MLDTRARLTVQAAACLVIALAAGGASVLRAEDAADEIVRRVQERYDQTADFTASVRQEMVLSSLGRTKVAEGSVAFKRPGRMRWTLSDRESKKEEVIVADGQMIWLYQAGEEQVLKAPFQAAFRSTTPISFLSGVGKISADFEPSLAGRSSERIDLLLRPRRGEGELGLLQLAIDAKTYDIVGAEVRDPLGNVTRLELKDIKRNVGLSDDIFRFDVPPGVDVIEAPIGY